MKQTMFGRIQSRRYVRNVCVWCKNYDSCSTIAKNGDGRVRCEFTNTSIIFFPLKLKSGICVGSLRLLQKHRTDDSSNDYVWLCEDVDSKQRVRVHERTLRRKADACRLSGLHHNIFMEEDKLLRVSRKSSSHVVYEYSSPVGQSVSIRVTDSAGHAHYQKLQCDECGGLVRRDPRRYPVCEKCGLVVGTDIYSCTQSEICDTDEDRNTSESFE
jgi:hypothetical protein